MSNYKILVNGVEVTGDVQVIPADAPPDEQSISLDRGAYLPVPKRIQITGGPNGCIVSPLVYLTQGPPNEFSAANDPLVFSIENNYGDGYGKGFVLDFTQVVRPVPEGYDSFRTTTTLQNCRGILVKSGLSQSVVGSIAITVE